ncbi:restriction endonuclease S subunit [Halobacteroides halobius DSM 5150]|uniref:Restriction endonuclease S subunit n=1 Tax=Halobacteroides halobius (strain ATCC 35273 / DSM 5150 / MD-1) TaxID=748449 RepID=L0K914_HALHC|nr:restriction endonuclease subunit S [Halobacteroides halobius]AGB41040.1 restriction endonuclease S subunit [Halobacteroides halobius DSM 5150]
MVAENSFLVNPDQKEFIDRLDAEFYHPKYRKNPFVKDLLEPLGRVAETVNRKPEPGQRYHYIELSSLDKETKRIKEAEQLELYDYQDLPSRAKTIVQAGDILVSKLGEKMITVVEQKHQGSVATNAFIVLRPQVDLSSEAFAFILELEPVKKQLERYSYGLRQRITNRDFKKIKLPIPKRIEDRRRLESRVDYYLAEKKRVVEEYQSLFSQLEDILLEELSIEVTTEEDRDSFQVPGEMIEVASFAPKFYSPEYVVVLNQIKEHDYKSYRLRELVEQVAVGRPLRASKEGDTKYLTSKNIEQLEIDLSKLASTEVSGTISSLEEGDLVVVTAGSKLGTTALVSEEAAGVTFNNHIYRLVTTERIDQFYLAVYLNSILGDKQFKRYIGGAMHQNISKQDLSNLEILLPPKEIQQRISNKLREVYKRIKAGYQQLEEEKEEIEEKVISMLSK